MSKKDSRILWAWVPALAYMGLIWTLSSLDLDAPIEHFPLRDKGIHFCEYGVLGFLLAHAAFRTWPRHHLLRTAALAVCITVLWGWLDEIHQAFVPGRSSEALDVVADSVGALAGVGARSLIRLLFARRKSARRMSARRMSAEGRTAPR